MRDRIPIGEAHTVFGLAAMVGISISVFVKKADHCRTIKHAEVDWRATRVEKFRSLREYNNVAGVPWTKIVPDDFGTWLTPENADEFQAFIELGSKAARSGVNDQSIFKAYSLGVSTNRDSVVYSFDENMLQSRVTSFCESYNSEIDRFIRAKQPKDVDAFVDYTKVKWSSTLKSNLRRGRDETFRPEKIRQALYRPFCRRFLYYSEVIVDRPALFSRIFPYGIKDVSNRVLALSDIGYRADVYSSIVAAEPVDLHCCASTDGHQCFPFYVYDEDGTNRRENITDWALKHCREHYKDKKITKWDIFYYVYGVLHHPGYRTKFADNLKRELPRIPLAPDFKAFAKAGKKLADLHLNYESLEPWPLEWIETEGVPLSYEVEKMRLSKDKSQLKVNESLTLGKIPPEIFNYRLGNRSALDWVIDQYQKKTDKRSGIESDPNNPDDEKYIVRLVGQVVRVSVETVKIVDGLPEDYGAKA